MGVGRHHRGHLGIEDDAAIGLIGDKIDPSPEAGARRREEPAEAGDFSGRINRARGVVGRVDQHHAGLRGDGPIDGCEVQVEARVGRGRFELGVYQEGVVVVAEKIGGRGEDLLARVYKGPQDVVERAGRADRDHDHLWRDGHPMLRGQALSQRRAQRKVSGHRGVAEREGIRADELPQGCAELVRGRDVGVSQREVADVLGPEALLQPPALLEHVLDDGEVRHPAYHPVCNRHGLLPAAITSAAPHVKV